MVLLVKGIAKVSVPKVCPRRVVDAPNEIRRVGGQQRPNDGDNDDTKRNLMTMPPYPYRCHNTSERPHPPNQNQRLRIAIIVVLVVPPKIGRSSSSKRGCHDRCTVGVVVAPHPPLLLRGVVGVNWKELVLLAEQKIVQHPPQTLPNHCTSLIQPSIVSNNPSLWFPSLTLSPKIVMKVLLPNLGCIPPDSVLPWILKRI
mmetsp:Transcript_13069/g.14664  ORF Transcript_13069/g.14664 Transcript_13069/m.14664 type:complete len:200 (+) Transcript_13069:140-739(+)